MMTIEQIQQRIKDCEQLQIVGNSSQTKTHHTNTLDMSAYNGIIEYHPEELVITVKAGTSIQTIEQILATHDQALPFFISNTDATIGGAYAVGGADLRDAVLGIKLVDGQGRLLTFGGQVMKNVAGYDVARLLVGSKGQLAVICEISFKVLPSSYVTTSEPSFTTPPPSKIRQQLEQGLKNIFDPNSVFI